MPKTVKQIRKQMVAAINAYQTVRERLHNVSCDALEHFKEHGDTTLLSEWLNMFREKGSPYGKPLLAWMKEFGGVTVREGDQPGGDIVLVKGKKCVLALIDIEAARARPFFEMVAKEDKLPSFDAIKVLTGLVKRQGEAEQAPELFSNVKKLTADDLRVVQGIVERHAA